MARARGSQGFARPSQLLHLLHLLSSLSSSSLPTYLASDSASLFPLPSPSSSLLPNLPPSLSLASHPSIIIILFFFFFYFYFYLSPPFVLSIAARSPIKLHLQLSFCWTDPPQIVCRPRGESLRPLHAHPGSAVTVNRKSAIQYIHHYHLPSSPLALHPPPPRALTVAGLANLDCLRASKRPRQSPSVSSDSSSTEGSRRSSAPAWLNKMRSHRSSSKRPGSPVAVREGSSVSQMDGSCFGKPAAPDAKYVDEPVAQSGPPPLPSFLTLTEIGNASPASRRPISS